jgi:L-2-hydroxyglutarate oxidase
MSKFDITIIGGGIVGVASAYKIQKNHPHLKILIVEKEDRLSAHQTGHNSGVIHSGLYYTPGSHKARNCMTGREEIVAFAKEYGIDYDVCGKVIAAVDESELPFMEKILDNGIKNGLTGVKKITAEEIKEIEPYVESIGGLWVPQTGIIDYVGVTNKMAELVLEINPESKIVLGETALDFIKDGDTHRLITDKNEYSTRKFIFCAGLHADRLARKDGIDLKERVVGFRGDYYVLTERAKHKVKNLIYPVPNPAFPFLGVHFTRMTEGHTECGPSAVFTFKREGYKRTDFDLRDTIEALSYSGTWKLFLNNIKFGIDEQRRAFSKKLFLKTLQKVIPSLEMDDIEPGGSGVRALLLRQDGDTKDDFRIMYNDHAIHVLNAPSPAATASLAIGDDIRKMAEDHFGLK